MDEVFEAFISARNVDPSELGFEDNFISKEEVGCGGIPNQVLQNDPLYSGGEVQGKREAE